MSGDEGWYMDGGGHAAALPSSALDVLDAVWHQPTPLSGGSSERERLRAAARQVSASARERGLRAEHLIRCIKDSWRAYDGFGSSAERHATEWLLTEVVSLCIREFYRDGAAETGVADARGVIRQDGTRSRDAGRAEPGIG